MKKKIPAVDLEYQHNIVKSGFEKRLNKLFTDFDFVLGKAVYEFEEKFAEWTGSKYCITTSSGTSALELIVKCIYQRTSSEGCIVPTNSFHASASSAKWLNQEVLFADCDDDYLIDLELLDKKLEKYRNFYFSYDTYFYYPALMLVHLYGQMADVVRAKQLCDKYKLPFIEDAAQAHGAKINGHKVGELSDFAAYSFFPGKNLGSCGGGGAITTNNKECADILRQMKWFGCSEKNVHNMVGTNSKMDTIEAIYLLEKLKYIDEWNDDRNRVAERYLYNLTGVQNLVLPIHHIGRKHVYHQFVVRVSGRDKLISDHKETISFGIHYPTLIHLQGGFNGRVGDCPKAEQFSKEIVSVPIHPGLLNENIDFISECIIKHCEGDK